MGNWGFAETLVLPMPPLVSIESIKYTTVDGDEVTLDAADYDVNARGEPATVQLNIELIGPVRKNSSQRTERLRNTAERIFALAKTYGGSYYENRQAILPMGHSILENTICCGLSHTKLSDVWGDINAHWQHEASE